MFKGNESTLKEQLQYCMSKCQGAAKCFPLMIMAGVGGLTGLIHAGLGQSILKTLDGHLSDGEKKIKSTN